MTTKFTPGPWVSSKAPGGYGSPKVVALDGEWIRTTVAGRGVSLLPADAHLIAAAPDLYEALRRSLDWLSSYQGGGALNVYKQAKAAIAKAEGKAS